MSIENISADYHLFLDIQMGKYLRSVNKSEFTSDEEAKFVVGRILQTWNDKIADQHKRLDESSAEAKSIWFNTIDIDFEDKKGLPPALESKFDIRKITGEMLAYYDELFSFLPEKAVLYLLFAGPALTAYGYSLDRLNKLIEGEEPTAVEKDLLNWAYNLSSCIISAHLEKGEAMRDKLLGAAYSIANSGLDEKTSIEVIAEISVGVREFLDDTAKKEKNSKQKKGRKRY